MDCGPVPPSTDGSLNRDLIPKRLELRCRSNGFRGRLMGGGGFPIPFNDKKALPNVVMKWTDHSDYSSMKPYIDIVDDIKATSMTKFNGLP